MRDDQREPLTLREAINDFVRLVRTRYRTQIEGDPSGFKKTLLKELREEMPPFAGRPTSPEIDHAERLREKGIAFDRIAREVNPQYAQMDRYRQMWYRNSLRSALKQRRRKERLIERNNTPGSKNN